MPDRRFTADDAKRFNDRFGARLGCGTGRLAERLLRGHLPPNARYVGVDVSATMVGLTERRLASWGDRLTVRLADGTGRWPEPDGACDRFVAAYVLDLLDEPAIATCCAKHTAWSVRGACFARSP